MDPRDVVKALLARGISEYEQAKRLRQRGTPVSQSTINRISTGATGNPSYRVVKALAALYEEVVSPRRRKQAA